MHAESRRYSKKKGLMRVSAMLPKRVVRKYIERDLVHLREKIYQIHNSYEVNRSFSVLFPRGAQVILIRNGLTIFSARSRIPSGPVACQRQGDSQSKLVRGLISPNPSEPRGR